jgi:glycosyltransferase involved in cell wall biosynthesis
MAAYDLVLVNSVSEPGVDAIDAYTGLLAEALERLGKRVARLVRTPDGWSSRDVTRDLRGGRTLVLQYNPFNWGRRGFAPWLPALIARVRRGPAPPRVALMLHELYMSADSPRHAAMGIWQRAQLAALCSQADAAFTSTETWARDRNHVRPSIVHLPVGSNVPDRREERGAQRAALGAQENDLVLASFGRSHPSRLIGHVESAANAIAAGGRTVMLLNLGDGAPRLTGLSRNVTEITPGRLAAAELATTLAAADLYLAPFVDGVSTRRGSMVAALQHGIPVVGTRGPSTGPLLGRSDGLVLSDPGDSAAAFAQAARRLADDGAARRSAGAAARELFERHFDWGVIAQRMIEGVA